VLRNLDARGMDDPWMCRRYHRCVG
jgi:hypothetical protein